MKIAGSKILLTGAAGGIGRELAAGLVRQGAELALVGRSARDLHALADTLHAIGKRPVVLPFDLARDAGHRALIQQATLALGGLDALINNAGMSRFEPFADADPQALQDMLAVNLASPLLLTHAALTVFKSQGRGHIVNIGSAFGTLAYPHFAAYSATKFGLRGFSEALRRELQGSGMTVTYVAPRATATKMNGTAVRALFATTGTTMDAPQRVADIVIDALAHNRNEVYIGWPERFFVRLNALLPRWVDRALAKETQLIARHADEKSVAP